MLRYKSIGDHTVFADRARGADLIKAHEPRVARQRRPRLWRLTCVRPELAAFASWPSCPSGTVSARMPPAASLSLGAGRVNKWPPGSLRISRHSVRVLMQALLSKLGVRTLYPPFENGLISVASNPAMSAGSRRRVREGGRISRGCRPSFERCSVCSLNLGSTSESRVTCSRGGSQAHFL